MSREVKTNNDLNQCLCDRNGVLKTYSTYEGKALKGVATTVEERRYDLYDLAAWHNEL